MNKDVLKSIGYRSDNSYRKSRKYQEYKNSRFPSICPCCGKQAEVLYFREYGIDVLTFTSHKLNQQIMTLCKKCFRRTCRYKNGSIVPLEEANRRLDRLISPS